MLRLVDEYASNMGMEAYYMYRQKIFQVTLRISDIVFQTKNVYIIS